MALPNLTLAQVNAASGVDLETWAKDFTALERRVKETGDTLKGSLFDAGMVVYGVKRHHTELQARKDVGSTAPWSTTWKRMTGIDKPSPRATTMAIGIEAYVVESGHLTEAELRACPVDSTETAVGIYRDVGEQLNDAAVLEARTLLKGYTGPLSDKERKGIIKKLKDLRRSLKVVEPMDAEEALERIKSVLSANPSFSILVATELVAHLRYEKETTVLRGVWNQFQLADDVWPADEVEAWLSASSAPSTPANVTAPVPAPAPIAPTRSEPAAQAAPAPTPEPAAPAPSPTVDLDGWLNTNMAQENLDARIPLRKALAKVTAMHGGTPPENRHQFLVWMTEAKAAMNTAAA